MDIVADESVDFSIVTKLRGDGLDIYAIVESHPSISDDEVLQIAFNHKSLLITEDKDFGELAIRFRKPHRGILLIKLSGLDSEEKAKRVSRLIKERRTELQDAFSVLDEKKIRIKKLNI